MVPEWEEVTTKLLDHAERAIRAGTPVDRALSDVRDAVSKVRSELPEGVDEPQVSRIDVEGGAIAYYAVGTTGRTPEQLSWFVDNTLAKRMLSVSGVSQVSRDGGVSREIRIKLDPGKLEAQGVTAAAVSNQLRASNVNLPGGRGQIGGEEQAIRTVGSAGKPQRVRSSRLPLPRSSSNGKPC